MYLKSLEGQKSSLIYKKRDHFDPFFYMGLTYLYQARRLMIILFLTLCAIIFPVRLLANTIITQNKNKDWFEKNLSSYLQVVKMSQTNTLELKFKGFCPEMIYTLSPGDKFCKRKDRHSESEFKFLSIKDSKVIIQYEINLDQRSFGKGKSVDHGTLELDQ